MKNKTIYTTTLGGMNHKVQSTPSNQRVNLPGVAKQVQNQAGGFVFEESDMLKLVRFLVYGTATQSYYVSAEVATKDATNMIVGLLKKDWKTAIDKVVELSELGLPKNDTAIYFMVIATRMAPSFECSRYAWSQFSKVCRIGTHRMMFVEMMTSLGAGWGSATKRNLGDFYLNAPLGRVSYDVVKYRNRNNWSQRDLIRSAHPFSKEDEKRNVLLDYVVNGWDAMKTASAHTTGSVVFTPKVNGTPHVVDLGEDFSHIIGFEMAKAAGDVPTIIEIIGKYGLTWEMIPNHFLSEPKVWEALLPNLGLTAIMRNLNKLTIAGLMRNGTSTQRFVMDRLTSVDQIRKARIHPMNALVSMKAYALGRGLKGSLTWNPEMSVTNALEEMFYKSYGNVKDTGKVIMVGIDGSGSMSTPCRGTDSAGLIQAVEVATALAMVYLNTQSFSFSGLWDTQYVPMSDKVDPVSWIANYDSYRYGYGRTSSSGIPSIKGMRLNDALKVVKTCSGSGGTNASATYDYAKANKMHINVFLQITDAQTWYGGSHTYQAFNQYKNESGNGSSRSIIAQVASDKGQLSDPNDSSQLEIIGFDLSAVDVVEKFMAGVI